MNCLIVDDNPLARLAIRNMILEVGDLELAGEFENATQAYNFLHQNNCDLLFLDVEMPGMSGLELLKTIDHRPLVILITSKTEYAIEGFEMQVVDYLLKPVSFPRLLKAIHHAKELYAWKQSPAPLSDNQEFLFARVNGQMTRIDFADILFVESMGDYVIFHTHSRKYMVHLTMKGVEEKIPNDRFIRVHRGYIVALDKIDNMVQNSLQIEKHLVPVSETYKGQLMERMNMLNN
jgi:DNA-binding LytR/AlgR family response regulator